MGDLSPHFSAAEFTCRCGRRWRRHARVSPQLVDVLERLRTRKARPLSIVSGVRCQAHNRRVGGSPNSQHLRGRAADLPFGYATVEEALGAGARGVGHRSGWAVHVDVRDGPVVTFPD